MSKLRCALAMMPTVSHRADRIASPSGLQTAHYFRIWWSISVSAGMKGAMTLIWFAAAAMKSV
jgi:hypothetical protein